MIYGMTDDEIVAAMEELAATNEGLEAKLAENEVRLCKAVEALRFYAWENEIRLPSDGPWGAGSTDFGKVARTTLAEIKGDTIAKIKPTPKTITEWPEEEGNIMVGKMKETSNDSEHA